MLSAAPTTLIVERFDRATFGGSTMRTHQEDASQSIGVPSEKKYAGSGTANKTDPTLAKIVHVLERFANDPQQELLNRLRQVVVNVAMGNTDAHAKNYGILHPNAQTASLSPMYDLVPAQVINPATLEMGLRITGAKILDEAKTWGIGPRISVVVEEALQQLLVGSDLATDRFSDVNPAIIEFVKARVGHLLDTLREAE